MLSDCGKVAEQEQNRELKNKENVITLKQMSGEITASEENNRGKLVSTFNFNH